MGVVQRFERRLEHLVEGAFAKVFKGEVQPVEIAQALQREADDRRAVVSQGRVLVPNDYVVELGSRDYDRLAPYAAALGEELAAMVREHAAEAAYSFVGPVTVTFDHVEDLGTGLFRVRSGVAAGSSVDGGVMHVGGRNPASREGRPEPSEDETLPGRPRLSVSRGEEVDEHTPEGQGVEEVYFLRDRVTVIGRGHDADIRLDDPRVSRRHAELRFEGNAVILVDLDSTNGTTVNDVPVSRRQLVPSDRVGVGTSTLLYDRDTGV